MSKLVKPSVKYKKSFLEATKEPGAQKLFERFRKYFQKKPFDEFVETIKGYAKGKNLNPGYVPESTYWLVDKNEYIGRLSIRHRLTKKLLKEGGHIGYEIRPSKRRKGYGKKILKLGLKKAKKLGFNKVLVTCDETNIASKKIIEANGGVLKNKIETKKGRPKKLRYWIYL